MNVQCGRSPETPLDASLPDVGLGKGDEGVQVRTRVSNPEIETRTHRAPTQKLGSIKAVKGKMCSALALWGLLLQ